MGKTPNSQSSIASGQLALALPEEPPRYARDGFLISESNEAAWRAAQGWLRSAEPSLIICGPPGSGKTHLAHILAGDDGVFAPPSYADVSLGAAPLIVFDDLPAPDPKEFLHLIEELADSGKRTLLAGAGHPSEWALGLKDLRTRLEAMPRAILGEPDEPLIRAVIAKGFADRQLVVPPSVIDYAVPRMPRRFEAAHAFVATADQASLTEKRKISVQFAQKILQKLFEADPQA